MTRSEAVWRSVRISPLIFFGTTNFHQTCSSSDNSHLRYNNPLDNVKRSHWAHIFLMPLLFVNNIIPRRWIITCFFPADDFGNVSILQLLFSKTLFCPTFKPRFFKGINLHFFFYPQDIPSDISGGSALWCRFSSVNSTIAESVFALITDFLDPSSLTKLWSSACGSLFPFPCLSVLAGFLAALAALISAWQSLRNNDPSHCTSNILRISFLND